MEFRDLVMVLSDFGLWEKVAGCYEGENYLGDEFLEEHIRKYSTSDKLIIRAIVGIYHGRRLVSFYELYRFLDGENTEKLIKCWRKDFTIDK